MTTVQISDPLAMRDLASFTSMAHRADSDGAMRLQVFSDVLVATVAPLFPHGLGDSTPLVLAMRMLRLRDSVLDGLDEAVPLSNLLDRFARAENGTALPVPPNSVLVSWTGIAPPRGGWQSYDSISVGALHEASAAGVAEISNGAPEGSGANAVKTLRSRVWSREMSGEQGTSLPSGLAFAATALRFIPPAGRNDDEQLSVMESAGWLRLVAPGGHMLTRLQG